jgi:hypothetical protein
VNNASQPVTLSRTSVACAPCCKQEHVDAAERDAQVVNPFRPSAMRRIGMQQIHEQQDEKRRAQKVTHA